MSRATTARLLRVLLLGAAGYYAGWGGEYSVFDLRRLADEREHRAADLTAARAEVDSLRALASLLDSDKATLERAARERFGMIRRGEVLYRFVEVAPADSAAIRPVAGLDTVRAGH